MKLRLKIMSFWRIWFTIPIVVTVKTQTLLCSSWWNVSTLTLMTQLAPISSISCNIQHLAQQHSQHNLQWLMLHQRTFCYFRRANMANAQSIPHNDIIQQMKPTVASKQTESEPLGHCATCESKCSLWWRNEQKRIVYARKRKRNELRIMLGNRPLWPESVWKNERERLSRSRKI